MKSIVDERELAWVLLIVQVIKLLISVCIYVCVCCVTVWSFSHSNQSLCHHQWLVVFNTALSMFTCIPLQHERLPVKMNTTAVLREGARLHRAEEEEDRRLGTCIDHVNKLIMLFSHVRLADLEAGHKDSSEFLKWQRDMKQVWEVTKQANWVCRVVPYEVM